MTSINLLVNILLTLYFTSVWPILCSLCPPQHLRTNFLVLKTSFWSSCKIGHDCVKIWGCLTFCSFLKPILNRFLTKVSGALKTPCHKQTHFAHFQLLRKVSQKRRESFQKTILSPAPSSFWINYWEWSGSQLNNHIRWNVIILTHIYIYLYLSSCWRLHKLMFD